MSKGTDLSTLYELRRDFTIIGLTGRTGSGVTSVADFLATGFEGVKKDLKQPTELRQHNSARKYRIVYNYVSKNFEPFVPIRYRDVLCLFIIEYGFDAFVNFLQDTKGELKQKFRKTKLSVSPDFSAEIGVLKSVENEFRNLTANLSRIDKSVYKYNRELYTFFSSGQFLQFSAKLHEILKSSSQVKRNKLLQIVSNNLRKTGAPYNSSDIDPKAVFTIAEAINSIIKGYRKLYPTNRHQFVIDSLRNTFEIMYFKQRFAAYYTISINREDSGREEKVEAIYKNEHEDAKKLIEEEYKGGEDNEFFKQKVKTCIENADIHISYLNDEEVKEKEEKRGKDDFTSPYYTWQMQVIKYLALISQPGIVTPSPEERCMQIAYTAKYNSGCISRQVGAAITDHNYSLKAIGWNNPPEGLVPCLLRNAEDLMQIHEGAELATIPDTTSFTPFEKSDSEFKRAFKKHFTDSLEENGELLKGRNVCMCFKSIKNSCSEGNNQVHTRSLHAEESAFLQITKYGGTGIQGGKLFCTASPCELCSKKAYQLGITVIYYVDPYRSISMPQILTAGHEKRNPELRLFNGAIGNAYFWLYEPLMPYKDETSLLLGQNIQDLAKDQSKQIEELKQQLKEKEAENAALKASFDKEG